MKHFARVVPLIVFHGTPNKTVTPINGDQTVQQWMYPDAEKKLMDQQKE